MTEVIDTTPKLSPAAALAVKNAGSPEGVMSEPSLTDPQVEAAMAFMEGGLIVPLKGLHPFGGYSGGSAVALPKTSQVYRDAVERYSQALYREAWGDAWQDRVRRMKLVKLPHHGDRLVEIASAVFQIVGWKGVLYDGDDPYDMTDQPAEVVQGFLWKKFTRWWIHKDKKNGLPAYDPSHINGSFLEMLDATGKAVDREVTVFLIHSHLQGETSGSPYVVMHAGTLEAGEEETEPSDL